MEEINRLLKEKDLLENEKKIRIETLRNKREEFVMDCFLGLDFEKLVKLNILGNNKLTYGFEQYLIKHEERIDYEGKSQFEYRSVIWDKDCTLKGNLNYIFLYKFFDTYSKNDKIFYVDSYKYDILKFNSEEWDFIRKNLLLIKKHLFDYAKEHLNDQNLEFENKYIQYTCQFCGAEMENNVNFCSNCGTPFERNKIKEIKSDKKNNSSIFTERK